MLAGSGGGVVAFLEFPTSDGWRMRYYQDADLDDGPGDPAAGRLDFQGIHTHQLGHALGLGHSSVAGTTMSAAFAGQGLLARSIEADDAAGVQAVYGALTPGKPRIDAIVGARVPGGAAAVLGHGFAAAGNELWFDSALLDGGPAGGEPFVLANLAAQAGGMRIDFVVPAAGAEAGAVHVRVPGTAGRHLSESHPFHLGRATDALILAGPDTLAVGDRGRFVILNLAAGERWALVLGADLRGSVHFVQAFDLGPPLRVIAHGIAGDGGLVSWTSPPVPPQAAGRTLLLEAGALGALGVADSNPLAVPVR
ncbi:MAG TPA: matrixin family metalloprotease [Planctomycetota bacterium]